MNKKKLIVIGVAALLLIAILVAVILLIKENGENKSENEVDTTSTDSSYVIYGEDNDISDNWDVEDWNK